MRNPRTGITVTRMRDEVGFVVARTDDVDAARAAAEAWLRADDPLMDEEERRDLMASLVPRVGWYRWTPCSPNSCFDGGGHSGHLGYADQPGRGVFRGVYLQGPF